MKLYDFAKNKEAIEMKKILAVAATMATLATAAFAELSVGAWGRGIWAPVANAGGEAITFTSTSWGGDYRIGFGMDFRSENIDVHADYNLENGSANINDQLFIAVRPASMVTVRMGILQNDTLRGDAVFGSWDWLRPNWIDDEGWTMSRTVALHGIDATIKPFDGLDIVLGIPVEAQGRDNPDLGNKDKKEGANLAEEAYKNIKIGAGYKISDIGQVKLQFLANSAEKEVKKADSNITETKKALGVFEAAFNFTKVENLFVEAGAKFNLHEDKDEGENQFRAFATYNLNGINLAANFGYDVPRDSDKDPTTRFGAGVGFGLQNGIGIDADVRVNIPGAEDADPSVGFLLGASKGFSNGKISAGIQVVSVGEGSGNGFAGSIKPAEDGAYKDDGLVWVVPVCFTYWF